jgi:hypothetical protein
MIVLTKDVVSQLLTGLKAGQAERDAAAKKDTPFGRYQKAKTAYTVAGPKCEKAQQAFFMRAESNKKLLNKWTAYNDKVTAAQEKGDLELALAYQDSALAVQDPSCIVKEPEQPKGYYQAQRELDTRAEKLEAKASGFTPGEMAMIKERTTAILRGAPAPGGAAPEEKSAVSARAAELKPLLGVEDQPPAQAAKPAKPAPAPAPTPAPAYPEVSASTADLGACMAKNTQKHEAKLEALGTRAEAAEAAGDTQKLMALADTMLRLQMAGCQRP